jgi:hypothetical protein
MDELSGRTRLGILLLIPIRELSSRDLARRFLTLSVRDERGEASPDFVRTECL